MRPSERLRKHLDEVKAIIARYPVSNPRIFGSGARGKDREGSDIDLLVEPTEITSLFDLAGIKIELEELLGVPVDIATPGALRPDHRNRVLMDARAL